MENTTVEIQTETLGDFMVAIYEVMLALHQNPDLAAVATANVINETLGKEEDCTHE